MILYVYDYNTFEDNFNSMEDKDKSSALFQMASFNLSFANKEIRSKSSNIWCFIDVYIAMLL